MRLAGKDNNQFLGAKTWIFLIMISNTKKNIVENQQTITRMKKNLSSCTQIRRKNYTGKRKEVKDCLARVKIFRASSKKRRSNSRNAEDRRRTSQDRKSD
jgi:hypothetical protein